MLKSYDCVLIATDHDAYDFDWIGTHARMILDTRNAMSGVKSAKGKVYKA